MPQELSPEERIVRDAHAADYHAALGFKHAESFAAYHDIFPHPTTIADLGKVVAPAVRELTNGSVPATDSLDQ